MKYLKFEALEYVAYADRIGLQFAYLDIGAGDNVWLVAGLAGGLHLVLPTPLERQPSQHDGLGRADGAHSNSRFRVPERSIEEMRDHVHAPVLHNHNSDEKIQFKSMIILLFYSANGKVRKLQSCSSELVL